ncbi:ABC transporter substrate-binding protein [Streptomyces phytohabitans]|uniref:ABC transporter substrate-binding protein n=1 Tax=Streptomyces phytohabitans TaxID=1150371 RepID=UPI00345BB0E8
MTAPPALSPYPRPGPDPYSHQPSLRQQSSQQPHPRQSPPRQSYSRRAAGPVRRPFRPARRSFLALTGAAVLAAGCGRAVGGDRRTDTVRYQGWAGQVTPPELAADLGYLDGVKLEWVGNTISGPQDIQTAATGEIDVGGAFNGAVVKLAASGAPVTAVVSYYGTDALSYNSFFAAADGDLRTARDLRGEKVGVNTLGGHAEAVLDLYLRKHGLSSDEADDVQALVVPPVSTEQALRQGRIGVASLSGVLRDKARERGGLRELFNDYRLLGAFSAGTYVIADRFLERNPDTAASFVTGVARAVEWSRATPRAEVVDRMTAIVARRKRNEQAEPLRYWRSYGVAGPGGRIAEKELAFWADWLADRGEIERDAVRVAGIYTNEFNGYRRARSSRTGRAER